MTLLSKYSMQVKKWVEQTRIARWSLSAKYLCGFITTFAVN